MSTSETGTTRRSILRTGRLSVLSTTASVLAQLLLTPVVIHHVGLEKYGVYLILLSFLTFGGLLDFGMRSQLARRIGQLRGREDWQGMSRVASEYSSILTIAGGLVLVIGLLVGPLALRFAFEDASLVPQAFLLLTTILALSAIGYVVDARSSTLIGLQRTDVIQASQLVAIAIRSVAIVVLLEIHPDVWSLIVAHALGTLAAYAVVVVRLHTIAPQVNVWWSRLSTVAVRGALSGSLLLVASQVSDVVDYNVDRFLISHYAGLDDAAQFSVGTQLPLALRTMAIIPCAILLAAVAEFRVSRKNDLAPLLDGVTRLVMTLGTLSLVLTVALAPSFYALYLGVGFDETVRSAQLLAVATFINVASASWGAFATGSGWYRVIGAAAGANIVVNASLSYVLVRAVGYQGALIGSIAGTIVGVVVLYLGVRKREPLPWLGPTLRPLAAAIVCGAAGLYFQYRIHLDSWITVIAAGIVIALVTLGALIATRAISVSLLVSLVRRRVLRAPSVGVDGPPKSGGSPQ